MNSASVNQEWPTELRSVDHSVLQTRLNHRTNLGIERRKVLLSFRRRTVTLGIPCEPYLPLSPTYEETPYDCSTPGSFPP